MLLKPKTPFFYQGFFLIIASSLIQCDCKMPMPEREAISPIPVPPQLPPITDEMIRFVEQEWQTAYKPKFLATMLRKLKNKPSGVDINARDTAIGEGMTALHYAAMTKRADIVQALIARGAQVDIVDNDQALPLHYAAKQPGNIKSLSLLLPDNTKHNYLEQKYAGKYTPLHLVIDNGGDLEMIKWLVGKGAQIATRGHDGQTPLIMAAENGLIDVVRYLIGEKGADLTAVDDYLRTPLSYAAAHNHLQAVKYLVSQGAWVDINQKQTDSSGDFILKDRITDPEILNLLTKRTS